MPLRILGGILQSVIEQLPIEIADLNGGSAQNAIPREASAVLVLDAAREKELEVAGRQVGGRVTRPISAASIPICRLRWRRPRGRRR